MKILATSAFPLAEITKKNPIKVELKEKILFFFFFWHTAFRIFLPRAHRLFQFQGVLFLYLHQKTKKKIYDPFRCRQVDNY